MATKTGPSSPARRREAWQRGRHAERAVVADLTERGMTVLAVNLRVGRYELDVVACDADVVIVVEVRLRGPGSWQTGFASLDPVKRRRVRAAGERLWRDRFLRDGRVNRMRFDVAAVSVTDDGELAIEYAQGVL